MNTLWTNPTSAHDPEAPPAARHLPRTLRRAAPLALGWSIVAACLLVDAVIVAVVLVFMGVWP